MALFRTIESARSLKQRLFNDPLAFEFLTPSLRVPAVLARFPPFGEAISLMIDLRWKGARTSGIARTRYIDDCLKKALRNGYKQLLLLGAGFDSRAYRINELKSIPVIEVDHPSTSRHKQRLLEHSLGKLPSNVHFLEIDFNKQNLREALQGISCDRSLPTVIIWEGVTNYLTAEGVERTFQSLLYFQRCLLIFTYIDKAVLEPEVKSRQTASVKARLSKVDENWTFGFDPPRLPAFLSSHGFRLLEDIAANEYRLLYLPPRKRFLQGYAFYRIAVAETAFR
jgi:methyltransferase (TIGR00027 family)